MAAPKPGRRASLTIETLGSGGDGLAEAGGRRWFVPFTLPGETVTAKAEAVDRHGVHARLATVDAPSPERARPICRHFAAEPQACGGCRLQHLSPTRESAFKRELIAAALRARGLPEDGVAEPAVSPLGSRRRLTLAALGTKGGIVLGHYRRRSKHIVDLAECPIAEASIVAALPRLRAALAAVLAVGEGADLHVTACANGLAIRLTGPAMLDGGAREALGEAAAAGDWAEVTWRPHADEATEPVAARRSPEIVLAGQRVVLPPGAFRQATAAGEAALQELVARWLPSPSAGAGRLGDFFCGLGTLALPLAKAGWRVEARDSDAAAVAALTTAAGQAQLPVAAATRDLMAAPPGTGELAELEAAVFDPPRAGAAALADRLAESPVQNAVAVSCHPGTFARDARRLVDGGFTLQAVQPVDQFRFSPHVELAALFTRV